MSDTAPANSDQEPASTARQTASANSMVRILTTVVVLAVVIVGGGYWWVLGGGEQFFGNLTRPAFAKAQATVLWNGKSVDGVQIIAQPAESRCRHAIGFAQADGTIIFRTDTGGQYADGMDAGEYKLTVAAYEQQQGPAAPPLRTPAKYASMATTDLVITVDADPAKNNFVLELEGEAPARPSRPAAGGPPGGGPPAGGAARPTEDDGGRGESDRPQADSTPPEESSESKTPAADTSDEPESE